MERQLAGTRHMVLVGARAPVAFFAYPGRPSTHVPEGCEMHVLAGTADDAVGALEALAEEMGAPAVPTPTDARRPELPGGALTLETMAAAVGALLPEQAVVVDEALTSGAFLPRMTAGAPPHDWLTLTGGAIGQGLPVATGAAVACPDRPVVCLQADGSAMYTVSALWTQAREQLDVTTVVLANRSYRILVAELDRVGAEAGGARARSMLDLAPPELDSTALARGMGVPAVRARTADDLGAALRQAYAKPGPHLVEAVLP